MHASCADVFRPALNRKAVVYETGLIVAGSLAIAVSAQLAVRLPFSPVPITAQTLVVMLIGALYGSRRAAACVGAYLMEGAVGLPVFASGMAGLPYMLGPTGGYLAGFFVGATLTGWLAERGWDRRMHWAILAMASGYAVVFVLGLAWLSLFAGLQGAISTGLLPFLPGCALKIGIAAALMPTLWRVLRRWDERFGEPGNAL